jgi:hypothetical protein
MEQGLVDPPKSPLKRGTLRKTLVPLNKDFEANSPLFKRILNPVPPFLRGARGDLDKT